MKSSGRKKKEKGEKGNLLGLDVVLQRLLYLLSVKGYSFFLVLDSSVRGVMKEKKEGKGKEGGILNTIQEYVYKLLLNELRDHTY